jgi:serine/threonine protein kinase
LCAPNDVWSLGVILVNLTCGRNPWKQASQEDSTYRAFTKNEKFLKTILPVSDELNDILARIFTSDPKKRITLPELRRRIIACSKFTESSTPAPTTTPEYVCDESPMADADDEEYDCEDGAPLSPSSSDDASVEDDDVSTPISSVEDDAEEHMEDVDIIDEDCEDSEDDDAHSCLEDMPEAKTPPPQSQFGEPVIYETEDARLAAFHQQQLLQQQHQECLQQYHAATAIASMMPGNQAAMPSMPAVPVSVPVHQVPVPVPVPTPTTTTTTTTPIKFQQLQQYVWDLFRFGQPASQQQQQQQLPLHHPVPYHPQSHQFLQQHQQYHHQPNYHHAYHAFPLFAHMQGCY